jgi:hypothetical protein
MYFYTYVTCITIFKINVKTLNEIDIVFYEPSIYITITFVFQSLSAVAT